MLKLMYITKDPEVALAAEAAGVDRIWVDLEYIGKAERQGGMDTVQNRHTPEDVKALRRVLTCSQLMVRINPIHPGSANEIEAVIENGAEIIMLPFFKSAEEVETFLRLVNGRARTILLFETPESVEHVREILALPGIDECHIGLNDLHLGYHMNFMFEPLANGQVEELFRIFKDAGKICGFGGIARLGGGMLPAELILSEHVRLGSELVILSRSFCNAEQIGDIEMIRRTLTEGIAELREAERNLQMADKELLEKNRAELVDKVRFISERKS